MPPSPSLDSRRRALKCLAYGGAGTLFVLAGGVFAPVELAAAAADEAATRKLGGRCLCRSAIRTLVSIKMPTPMLSEPWSRPLRW